MLITKQKHLGRDSFWLNTFSGTALCDKDMQPPQVDTDGKNGRPELQTGSVGAVNRGCRHMWGKEFVCVGAKPLLALRTWKMKKSLLVGIMSLWLQRRQIWYHTKDTPTYARKGARGILMMMGVVDFRLFPLACLFSHMAACRARGIPMQVPWFGVTSSTGLIKACVPTSLPLLGHLWPTASHINSVSHTLKMVNKPTFWHRNLPFPVAGKGSLQRGPHFIT